MTKELWNILTKTTDSVRYSDSKAASLLTVHGVIITVIYTNATIVYTYVTSCWMTMFLGFLTAISILASVVISFMVVSPYLVKNITPSLMYFGDIQANFKNHQDYYQALKATFSDSDKIDEQLAQQIHVNSIIAWRKFTLVGRSIQFFYVSLFLLLVNLVVCLSVVSL